MKVSDANQLTQEINRLCELHYAHARRESKDFLQEIAEQTLVVQNALERCVTLDELRELLVGATK